MGSKKNKTLCLDDKYNIIQSLKSGVSREDIRIKYNLKYRSNVYAIWKNRQKIIEKYEKINKGCEEIIQSENLIMRK